MAKEIAGLGSEMQNAKLAAEQKQVAAEKAAAGGRIARGIGGALFSQAAAFGVGHIPMGGLMSNPMLVNGLVHAARSAPRPSPTEAPPRPWPPPPPPPRAPDPSSARTT